MSDERLHDARGATAGSGRVIRVEVGPGEESATRAAAGRRLAEAIAAAAPLNVRQARGRAPARAKSPEMLEVGSLVVSGTLSAGVLTALTRVVIAFIQRGGSRRVELEADGDRLVIEGASVATEHAAVEAWMERRLAHQPGNPAGAEDVD